MLCYTSVWAFVYHHTNVLARAGNKFLLSNWSQRDTEQFTSMQYRFALPGSVPMLHTSLYRNYGFLDLLHIFLDFLLGFPNLLDRLLFVVVAP